MWTLEHFTTLEIGEMYSKLVKCSDFLKLQPRVRGGQGYSKKRDGAFDLITCGGSSYKLKLLVVSFVPPAVTS